ncbi:hypothetical protein CICLE_v10010169mg, partial [Citrus x clementina]
MARIISRATPLPLTRTSYAAISFLNSPSISYKTHRLDASSPSKSSSLFGRGFRVLCRREEESVVRSSRKVFAEQRGYRKVRRRVAKSKQKELELNVSICIEDELPDDPEVLNIAEMLRLNAPTLMKLAFDSLKDSTYKTRDTAIEDAGGFESIELSILFCNDEFIRKHNKEWRDEDHATDVLYMSQHVPELKLPLLMLGDIVISFETAARQAEERGHSLLDEIRILMIVYLHALGSGVEWRKLCAYDCETNINIQVENSDDRKKEGSLRFYKPKFSYIFCDMDAAVSALKKVDLVGRDGIISEFAPGVFIQGLLVYSRQGREIFRRNLDRDFCREYSWENKVPLITFSGDHCLTLFDHPLVDSLHITYHEPKAEIIPAIEDLLAAADIQ